MDSLAGAEIDRLVADPHLLALGTGEVHLNAMPLGIVESVVLEGGEIEILAQLPVGPHQEIEIELVSHALGRVITTIANVGRLFQIDADDQHRSAPQDDGGAAQKLAGFVRLEIADRGAGKESGARP